MNPDELRVIVAGGESAEVEFKKSTGQRTDAARTIIHSAPLQQEILAVLAQIGPARVSEVRSALKTGASERKRPVCPPASARP